MLAKDYNEKYDFHKRKVEELLPNELSILQALLEDMLPEGVTYKITRSDTEQVYDYVDMFVEDMIEGYFDVSEDDIKKLVGTCFMNEDKTSVVEIVGMTDKKDEFLFEKYEKWGSDVSWHCQNYNWLQNSVYGKYPDETLKKYCLTDQTDMNIASENMFMVGKDGNLYVDMTCGNDYIIYKPIKTTTFKLIKEEALENKNN